MQRRPAAVAALVALGVLAGSLAPGSTAGSLPAGADKLLHASGYALLSFFAARAVEAPDRQQFVVVVVAVTAYGAGIELVQPAVGRQASALDALTNLAGAVAGAAAAWLSRTR